MPWNETDRTSEQRRFIECVLAGGDTFSALCDIFGVSRKTGYKRLRRYRAFGLEGIGDRSRAPYRHPNQTPAELVELILKAKQAYRSTTSPTTHCYRSRSQPRSPRSLRRGAEPAYRFLMYTHA